MTSTTYMFVLLFNKIPQTVWSKFFRRIWNDLTIVITDPSKEFRCWQKDTLYWV